jgi:hypothetical protein
MADLIKKGNKLTTLQLQPGWTIEGDGYGLMTSRLTFSCDASVAQAKKPKTNDPHPKDGKLLCHKSTYSINDNDLATITADYVGIESGNMTRVIVSGDTGLATQDIQVHPKFFQGNAGQTGKPLMDLGWDMAEKAFPATNAEAVSNALVGIKSFLAPDLQFSGIYYTSSKEILSSNQKMVGKTFKEIAGASDMVIPQSLTFSSAKHTRFGLMTSCNYEIYANIYKVRFTFRVATGGWHSYIYETYN